MKFKVGDKVIITHNVPTDWFFKPGDRAVVKELTPKSSWPYLIEFPEASKNRYGYVGEKHIRRDRVRVKAVSDVREVDLNEGDFVVMLKEGDSYAPSSTPKVYSTERQAMHVAKAMSKKHGGRFVAFKAIGEAELPQVEPTVRRYA